MSRIIAVLVVMMTTWANAQTAPAGQTQAPAAQAAASASASASAPVAIDLGNLGGLSVKVGTATGTLSIEPITVQVGPKKPATRAPASASASASARASANASANDQGRLVIMKCDNSFSVTPTKELGTFVHEARNCAPVATEVAPATVRIIEAPTVVAQATAAASVGSPAAAPAANATTPVTRCRAISNGTLYKKGDTGKTRIPQGTVVAVSIVDPSTPNAQLFPRLAGESCQAWELREVDPHYVRS